MQRLLQRARGHVFSRSTGASVCALVLAAGAGVATADAAAAAELPAPTGLTATAPVRGIVHASWQGQQAGGDGRYLVEVHVPGTSAYYEQRTTATSADVRVPHAGPYDVRVSYVEGADSSAQARVDGVVPPTQQLVVSRGEDAAVAVPMDSTSALQGPVDLDLRGTTALNYDRWTSWVTRADGLHYADVSGSQSSTVLPGTEGAAGEPAALADGDRVAFLKPVVGGLSELWMYTRSAGSQKVLDAGPYSHVRGTHLADKVLVVRTTTTSGTSDVASVDVVTQRVVGGGAMTQGYTDVAVDRTGRLALFGTGPGLKLAPWQWPAPAQNWSMTYGGVGPFSHPTWNPTGSFLAAVVTPEGQAPSVAVISPSGSVVSQVPAPSGVTGVAWSREDLQGPVVTGLGGPAYTKDATQSFRFAAEDADDPSSRISLTCSTDLNHADGTVDSRACATSYTTPSLSEGAHSMTVQAVSGGRTSSATHSWVRDTTAPLTAPAVLASAYVGSTMSVRVSASDVYGVTTYDTAYRSAGINGSLGPWQYPTAASWSGRAVSTPLTMGVTQGSEYCLAFRARDRAGNVGAWSPARCTAVVRDDRGLSAGTGWTRGTHSAYAYGTYTVARRAGSVLSIAARGNRVGITAARCSTCGAVNVYWGNVYVGRVNLNGATAYKTTFWLPTQSVTRSGSIVLKTVDSRSVIVDGVAVLH